jgi:hypothetical protein
MPAIHAQTKVMTTDLRTRAGREDEIRHQVKRSGGISRAWAEEYPARNAAMERLIASGEIKITGQRWSPWIAARLTFKTKP